MEFSIRPKIEVAKQFLREVKQELKKVTWPSRKDTLSGTAVVLVAVFVIAIFLGDCRFRPFEPRPRVVKKGDRMRPRRSQW